MFLICLKQESYTSSTKKNTHLILQDYLRRRHFDHINMDIVYGMGALSTKWDTVHIKLVEIIIQS